MLGKKISIFRAQYDPENAKIILHPRISESYFFPKYKLLSFYEHSFKLSKSDVEYSFITNTVSADDYNINAFQITTADIKNVRISDTGIEYKTPSNPKKIGRIIANPTPNTISLTIDKNVDASAFPSDCR